MIMINELEDWECYREEEYYMTTQGGKTLDNEGEDDRWRIKGGAHKREDLDPPEVCDACGGTGQVKEFEVCTVCGGLGEK